MRPTSPPPAGDSAGRLFLGVGLPDDLRHALDSHLRQALGNQALPGRAVPAANWHFTLRFLGDTPLSRLDALRHELDEPETGAAFRVGFSGYGAFPHPARASVLWLGVGEGEEALQRLAGAVEVAVRRAGFPAEERPFRAHLTLSRIQPPRDVRELLRCLPSFHESMEVSGVTLFRSHLGGGPARYEPLEQFRLRQAGA
jgi:RNA 2',3'-cyclic 3'-phosphodiesterase